MRKMPLVSVIMPVYNAKVHVGRAIESVLNQDFDSFELILVDDGSTDGSGAICEEFAKGDSRIVLIRQRNAGTCAARNTGLSIARGKYITFCDHDDVYLPHLLRDNFELIEREEADVLQFSVNRVFTEQNDLVLEQRLKNDVVLAKDMRQKYLDIRLNENFIDVWNHLYRRDLLVNAKFNTIFNHGLEDICFNLSLVPRIQKYVMNSGVYYNHYLYACSSGVVPRENVSNEIAAQLKHLFNAEYECLSKFYKADEQSELKGSQILKFNMAVLNARVNLFGRKDFDVFRKERLFCDYPLQLKFFDRLYLWSFLHSVCLYTFMTRNNLGFHGLEFKDSSLYGFFNDLYKSKKGRWLFNICDAIVKIITLPFQKIR